jgi:hypothetical protein
MDKNMIQEALRNLDINHCELNLDEETADNFSCYFSKQPYQICEERLDLDDSYFRDYRRTGYRKIDFKRVKQPFTRSAFTLSLAEQTWYIQNPMTKQLEGPFTVQKMEKLLREGKIKESTRIGFNGKELFSYKYFVEVAYPLPESKAKKRSLGNGYRTLRMPDSDNNVLTEDGSISNSGKKTGFFKSSENKNSAFKRQPFKAVPKGFMEVNTYVKDDFTPTNSDTKSRSYGSQFKLSGNTCTTNEGIDFVEERFLVKGKKFKINSFRHGSVKGNIDVETNPIFGKFTTAKKRHSDGAKVEYRKMIDFKGETEKVKFDKAKADEDEFDFDNLEMLEVNGED